MYVSPKGRKKGLITKMSHKCEQIARDKGYTKMLGSVDINTKWAEPPAIGMMRHGYKFYKLVGSTIFFLKDLSVEHKDTFKDIEGEL